MANPTHKDEESLDGSPRGIEAFLLQYVRAHPESRWQDIVSAACGGLRVSRSTVARQLKRLVQFGDLAVLPNGRYSPPEAREARSPILIETRLWEWTTVVHGDGSAWEHETREFRVLAGRVSRYRLNFNGPFQNLQWWFSSPTQLRWLPVGSQEPRLPVAEFTFDPALSARDARWERLSRGNDAIHRFRMYQGAVTPFSTDRSSATSPYEFESVGLEGLPIPGRSGPPEATPLLRVHLVLPQGYPFHGADFMVHAVGDVRRVDAEEQARIVHLEKNSGGQDGFLVHGSTFTLSIPAPKLDRQYVVRWGLPTRPQYERWLDSLRLPALDPPRPSARGRSGA
ncbi:MAG: hypothetical protein L3K03_00870 [Thermoplasmata archaeon]|nr:hypothetical protein [Thermoplasmata archaeon]